MATSITSRRRFLKTVPLATGSFGLVNTGLLASVGAQAQTSAADKSLNFQLLTAGQMLDAIAALDATPGNKNLVVAKKLPFAMVLTTEKHNSATEFEYHEGRDHIIQILEGSTVYELAGAPVGAHSTRPGEWLAPTSQGSTSVTLNKGDMLVVPRGTPHKRSTAESVTFLLISPSGTFVA